MRRIITRIITLVTVLSFVGTIAVATTAYAGPAGTAPVNIKVRVSEKGFFDEKGKPYGPSRRLSVPKGARVTLTFEFAEDLTSIAVGDTHQVTLRSEDGWIQETEKIWVMNRQASVTFVAGENGRAHYRAYCILDCVGMEHLTNLLVDVVSA